MTDALPFLPVEDGAPEAELGTKQPGAAKEAQEAGFLASGVLGLDVEAYVDDFNARVVGAYTRGTGSQELPADVGVARSLVPPGTAALRDFSYLSPLLPEFDAARCVGCMTCVVECPDTAILGKAMPASRVDVALARIPDPAGRTWVAAHWARTRKYVEVPARRGLEGALFGIFVDPTKCKGFGPTPREYVSDKALADMMLADPALLYVGGAGSCMGCGEATALRMMVARLPPLRLRPAEGGAALGAPVAAGQPVAEGGLAPAPQERRGRGLHHVRPGRGPLRPPVRRRGAPLGRASGGPGGSARPLAPAPGAGGPRSVRRALMATPRAADPPRRCPFLAPVVTDWLWLHPAGVYCRRPDGGVRLPGEITLARVCGTEAHRRCPAYRQGMRMVGLLPRALRTRVVRAEFPCPRTGRSVTVRFLADERERPQAVMACTAFADPTTVTCDQACLAAAGEAVRPAG